MSGIALHTWYHRLAAVLLLVLLAINGFRAATQLNIGLLVLDGREQLHHAPGIFFKVGGSAVGPCFDRGTRQGWILIASSGNKSNQLASNSKQPASKPIV